MAAKLPQAQSSAVDNLLPDEEGVEYTDLDAITIKDDSPTPNQDAERATQADEQDDVEQPDTKAKPGETLEDLRKMYADSQRMIGEQARELGEFRRRADMLIQAQLAAANRKPAEERKPLDDSEFFASPSKALGRAIEENPELARIRAETAKAQAGLEGLRRQQAKDAFDRTHPDHGDILASPEFQRWVGASPYRVNLLRAADQRYDFVAANELFGTWKEIQAARQPVKESASKDAEARRANAKRGAKVPTGGNATPSQEQGKKPIYRRAQILKLMETDRERYENMAPEIEAAYREGRVR